MKTDTLRDGVTLNNVLALASQDLACYCVAQWPRLNWLTATESS
jgi:hypothetical protein